MFYLKDKYKLGYRYGDLTFYHTRHLGVDDIVPVGTKLFVPFDGQITRTYFGSEGGYTTFLYVPSQNRTYRFLHLSKQLILAGSQVKEGDLFALSGNTGSQTTTAHVHLDCFTGNILPPLIYTNFINPETINWNPMLKQNIVILLYKPFNLDFVKSWVANAQEYIKNASGAQFEITVEYHDVSGETLNIITGVNSDGAPVVYVDPDQILDLAAPYLYGKSIATLIADYDQLSPRPTFDEAFPIKKYGMTISEKSALNPTGDLLVNAEFLVHEWLHNWYYILQSQGVAVIDDVHQHSGFGQSRPFSQIVMALKPYWAQLTKKGESMIIVHKKSDVNTKFYLDGAVKRGYADFSAFQKDTLGREVIDLALDDAEFNKIPSGALMKT